MRLRRRKHCFTQSTIRSMNKEVRSLDDVVIRFAGDSGDGMQLTGSQFTNTSAIIGNDISTFPDFPAEIRAPQGTLFGVSGFQLHFGSHELHSPGDYCDVLIAMNAAALKVNLSSLRRNGIIIVNTDGFNDKNLRLSGYTSNPLEDGSLDTYQVFAVDISRLTATALKELGLSSKVVDRTKNFFALGMMYWLYNRPMELTENWVRQKFGNKTPEVAEANIRAMHAGWNFGETTEIFITRYDVKAAPMQPGMYRNLNGNTALALGLVAAAQKAGLEIFFGSYPITPASDILHTLSGLKHFGVKTFQAEDEIASITSAIGAAFGGALGVTSTSGPGLALKTEAIGLAVMTELPVVIIDVQRAGPSTGMPTKTEQADLMQAIYGRNGEAPVPVIAPATPGDCFHAAFEAVRIALTSMTPVFILSDGYIANGSEPWPVPNFDELPAIDVRFHTEKENFQPYARDEKTLARPWAIPGTPGLEHRIGGLEKEDKTGNISYSPQNHQLMVDTRAEKIERIAQYLPPAEVEGDPQGDVLIVSWGGTYGVIKTAVENARKRGESVSHLHLRYLNPLQSNVGEILYNFKHVVVAELNKGQLIQILRSKYLVPAIGLNKVQGLPFKAEEVEAKISELLNR